MPRLGSRVRVPFSARLFFIINQDRFKFRAQVAELVDAHVSGACVERHAGSSPVLGTEIILLEFWRGGGIGRRATLRG